ncbi:hypothetical protein HMPREF9516_00726 [Enterococcus faecalis TX1302]|nr:hypothetical protein HMPREF9516_00726 [Enterococcus faecalis TX1302]
MYNFFALFLHQVVKNSHKTSIYKQGFTTAVSIRYKKKENVRNFALLQCFERILNVLFFILTTL